MLSDNRHGLVVNVQTSAADGYAVRNVAERTLSDVAKPDVRITVGADKGYDTPHVAHNIKRTDGSAANRRGTLATPSASASGSNSDSAGAR